MTREFVVGSDHVLCMCITKTVKGVGINYREDYQMEGIYHKNISMALFGGDPKISGTNYG